MILVIGASGFIGNYLIDDLINNGYEVFATCRNDAALQYFKTKKLNAAIWILVINIVLTNYHLSRLRP